MAWRIGVALGLAGGIIQVAFALIRPSQPPMVAARHKLREYVTVRVSYSRTRRNFRTVPRRYTYVVYRELPVAFPPDVTFRRHCFRSASGKDVTGSLEFRQRNHPLAFNMWGIT
jgi:hypothetical protein